MFKKLFGFLMRIVPITQLLQKLWKQFQSIVKKMVSLIHLLTMTKWR